MPAAKRAVAGALGPTGCRGLHGVVHWTHSGGGRPTHTPGLARLGVHFFWEPRFSAFHQLFCIGGRLGALSKGLLLCGPHWLYPVAYLGTPQHLGIDRKVVKVGNNLPF